MADSSSFGDLEDRYRAPLERFFDGAMTPGETVHALAHYHELFTVRTVARGGAPHPLPQGAGALPDIVLAADGRTFDIYDYLATNRVAGLLVMKDGKVVCENYELGATPETLWASCSMAKSIASTLVGAAILDGHIESLDDPLPRYIKPLAASAYADVSVRQLLQMTSGVQWDETYTNPKSDRRRLLETQLKFEPGAVVRHMSQLPRGAAPGSSWKYNTGDSYLVGELLQAATGLDPTQYLSTKVWARLGMERDAHWWVEGQGGMVFAGSGISATLRDYARFGQLVLDDGRIDGESIVPAGWFQEAGAAAVVGGRKVPYGYMWWLPELADPVLEGSFQAEGIYGQYLHINPRERLMIVLLSARSKPSFRSRLEFDDDAFFAAVAKALR